MLLALEQAGPVAIDPSQTTLLERRSFLLITDGHPMIAGQSDFDPLEEDDFPAGDGTTETEVVVVCPHCGEANELSLDPGGGPSQEYIEDCHVCCQPWRVTVRYGADGSATVLAEPLDA